MNHKGNEFKGFRGGKNYKRVASLWGMDTEFYRKGLGDISLGAGMRAIDLGCGPGALSFALAEKAHHESSITGIDLSDDQINYAKKFTGNFRCALDFKKISMDDLPFEDNSADIVMTSMALHETPPEVRRGAIKEAARVLKKEGTFLLVDWCRPLSLGVRALWSPMFLFPKMRDNWDNVYPELCAEAGFSMEEDYYISTIARRQVFIKKGGL